MVKLFQRTTPHPRLRHRRADAEHIRPAANPIQLGYHKTLQLKISMKTKKRFFTLMLALALAVCMAVPAFASNEDSNFMIPIASNYTWGANEVSVRKKDNSTSAYVNYNIPTSPNRIVVRIDGASGSAGPWYDCTSVIYGTSTSRRVAAVTFGQKGYVRQDVYERFGSNAWARIMARSADGSSGRANGRWSPDSVWESGCIEFNN